ncbi:MAG TPA: serine hydrolase domain-containing protein [Bacillales bacterium]
MELPRKAPEQVGINEDKLKRAFGLLEGEVKKERIPGATTIVGRYNQIVGTYFTGDSLIEDTVRHPVNLDTIYDCASLTKVVATLPLILTLVEKGYLDLNEPVSTYLSEFEKGKKAFITIRHLLTHTSGMKSFVSGQFKGWTPGEIKQYIYVQELEYEPGAQVVYSDLGFIVLGEIASVILGESLDQAVTKYIFNPLGMEESQFNPPAHLKKRIAATEFRENLGRHQQGEVHDERASALGGVSGHAGLFSTVNDLAKYASMWLNKGRNAQGGSILSPLTIEASLKNYTAPLDGNRGLGWVLRNDSFDAAGDFFSASSFGHTGFTGTSIWMDPESDLFVVLLTNRVHFGRGKSIARLRRIFHNAVASSIEKV